MGVSHMGDTQDMFGPCIAPPADHVRPIEPLYSMLLGEQWIRHHVVQNMTPYPVSPAWDSEIERSVQSVVGSMAISGFTLNDEDIANCRAIVKGEVDCKAQVQK